MARPPTPPGASGKIHIKEDSSGRYIASTYARRMDGKRIRVTASGSTSAAARRALADRVSSRTTVWDADTLAATATVEETVAAWLTWLEAQGELRPQSIIRYRTVARLHVIPTLGMLRLQEIRTTSLEGALRTMTHGVAPEAKKVLSGALSHARRLGVMVGDPLADVRLPKYDKSRPDSVPLERLPALRETIHQAGPLDLTELYDVLAVTGLRIGEALALRWDDVDFDYEDKAGPGFLLAITGTIVEEPKIRRQELPKNDASYRAVKVIPTTPAAEALLARRERFEAELGGLAPIWPAVHGGFSFEGSWNKRLRKALKGTEFEGTTSHTLRRTVATEMARTLGDRLAASLLGHGDIRTTQSHYIAPLSVVEAWTGVSPEENVIPFKKQSG